MAVSMHSILSFVAPRRPNARRVLSAVAAGLMFMAGGPSSAAEPADAEAGRKLFLKGSTPACAVCHALGDAGSAGTIGPNLDELKPDANRVAQAVRNGIGVMPAFDALSDADVQTLAKYVSSATGAAQ